MTVETMAGGRYRFEDVLGHGGMAVVYRAFDVELGRIVAVKVLAANLGREDPFRKRFVREARLAARLSHPNVVQIYDAGEDDGSPYIVMEYVPGSTLADVLRERGKLPSREAADLARQAALGLQHAHGAGLVHRDVKPQNLLLRDDGLLKVADFGIARAAESSRVTNVGTILGTAAYLAPEQAAGEDVTAHADIYSLGAVLYELLTERTPYEFGSLAELAARQNERVIVPVRDLEPSVPHDLEAIVMRCLARDPQFRPASAGEVAAGLRASLGRTGDTKETTADTVPVTSSRRVHRHRRARVWIGAAVLAAALAVALGLAAIGGNGGSSRRPAVVAPAVEPVPLGATPSADARNLARWLQKYSR